MIDRMERNYPLAKLTTIGIGGPADYFIEVKSISLLQKILSFCRQERIPYFILGKGSNILFDQKGFRGMVILNKIDFVNKITSDIWHVGAGYSFSLLGTKTAREGLSGLEFASGIPGSVGGAIFMNAGANGGEACQSLISVDFLTSDNVFKTFSKEDLEFGYRFSSFQKWKGVILGGTFKLTPKNEARKKQLDIIQYRKATQPYHEKSAGCVFRNPLGHHAGALIEKAGLKNQQIGEAKVSEMHANFVINNGNASSQEVLQLISFIQEKVKSETGILLESEIKYIPEEFKNND